MNIDNSFKFIPVREESSSCEVVLTKNKAIPRKGPDNRKKVIADTPLKKQLKNTLNKAGTVAKEIGLDIAHNPLKIAALPLLPAAFLLGCSIPSKPKDNQIYFPDDYGKPSGGISTNPGGGATGPSQTPAPILETPNPAVTPGPVITPGPLEIPDNSLEFDPANLEISNIDAAKLSQIKTEVSQMNNFDGAWNFFIKYKSLLDKLIKEKTVMEGFQKSLNLCKTSSYNELEISKALINYCLKNNFLIKDPSANTLEWQIFESSFEAIKTINPADAENIINNFLKYTPSNNYSSIDLLMRLLEKYTSLPASTGNITKLLQKIKSGFPAEISIENSALEEKHLKDLTVLILLASTFIVPGEFNNGLRKVIMASSVSGSGRYNPVDLTVKVHTNSPDVTVHELSHHWSMNVAPARLMQLYYQISWNENGTTASNKDEDFANSHGFIDKEEDFATMLGIYVEQGANLRTKIRGQLASGRFELASKYLFIKYFTPFKGKEFYTDVETPLRAKDVSDAIQSYKARTGKDASTSVMAIVNSILNSGK